MCIYCTKSSRMTILLVTKIINLFLLIETFSNCPSSHCDGLSYANEHVRDSVSHKRKLWSLETLKFQHWDLFHELGVHDFPLVVVHLSFVAINSSTHNQNNNNNNDGISEESAKSVPWNISNAATDSVINLLPNAFPSPK